MNGTAQVLLKKKTSQLHRFSCPSIMQPGMSEQPNRSETHQLSVLWCNVMERFLEKLVVLNNTFML